MLSASDRNCDAALRALHDAYSRAPQQWPRSLASEAEALRRLTLLGSACSTGSTEHVPCAPGTFNPSTRKSKCSRCVAGRFQDAEGATACNDCTPGYYCNEGAAAALPCPGGTTKPAGFVGAMHAQQRTFAALVLAAIAVVGGALYAAPSSLA